MDLPDNDLGRSARKRAAIVEAARVVFLAKGYGAASMDEIAARAAVSKQTIYKNFADKEQLFAEIISMDIREAERMTEAVVEALANSQDIETDLREFARRHIAEVMQPHLVQMRRLVIAEADRFPALALLWYASGPERAGNTLADLFSQLTKRGLLRMDDPLLAAQQFNWLVLSIPLNRAMFHGADEEPSPSQLDHYADAAVRVFMAAYGDRPAD